jgi:CMP-N,N'-diacetyllegionaminic acid synthase
MIVAIIPAKSNSKGIPGKNTIKLGTKTLIERAIESANIPLIDEIYVSTDLDSFEIPTSVGKVGMLYRPRELTLDSAQVSDVVAFSIRQLNVTATFPSVVVVLQPTSPFRTSAHVSDALKKYFCYQTSTLMSGYWQDKYSYTGTHECVRAIGHKPMHRTGRESNYIVRDRIFVENGAIYIASARHILTYNTFRSDNPIPFEMEEIESLEIDTPVDWRIAELFFKD